MKLLFNIEILQADSSFKVFLVKAKTYEEACVKLAKIHGEPNAFRLVGMFEQSNVDKDVYNRIK